MDIVQTPTPSTLLIMEFAMPNWLEFTPQTSSDTYVLCMYSWIADPVDAHE